MQAKFLSVTQGDDCYIDGPAGGAPVTSRILRRKLTFQHSDSAYVTCVASNLFAFMCTRSHRSKHNRLRDNRKQRHVLQGCFILDLYI